MKISQIFLLIAIISQISEATAVSLLAKSSNQEEKEQFLFEEDPTKSLASQIQFKLKIGQETFLPPTFARIPDNFVETSKKVLEYLLPDQKNLMEEKLLNMEKICRKLIAITQTQPKNKKDAVRLLQILLETSNAAIIAFDDVANQSYLSIKETLDKKPDSKELKKNLKNFTPKTLATLFINCVTQYQFWSLEVAHKISIECSNIENGENEYFEDLVEMTKKFLIASSEGNFFRLLPYEEFPFYPYQKQKIFENKEKSKEKNNKLLASTQKILAKRRSRKLSIIGKNSLGMLELSLAFNKEKKWKTANFKATWIKAFSNAPRIYFENYKKAAVPTKSKKKKLSKFFKKYRKVKNSSIRKFKKFKNFPKRSGLFKFSEICSSPYPIFDVTFLDMAREDLGIPTKASGKKNPKTDPAIESLEQIITNTSNKVEKFANAERKIFILAEEGNFEDIKSDLGTYFLNSYVTAVEFINASFIVYKKVISKAKKEAGGSSSNKKFFSKLKKSGMSSVYILNSLNSLFKIFLGKRKKFVGLTYDAINKKNGLISSDDEKFLKGVMRWDIFFSIYQRFVKYKFRTYKGLRKGQRAKVIARRSKKFLELLKTNIGEIGEDRDPAKIIAGYLSEDVSNVELKTRIGVIWKEEKQIVSSVKAKIDTYKNWDNLDHPDALFGVQNLLDSIQEFLGGFE